MAPTPIKIPIAIFERFDNFDHRAGANAVSSLYRFKRPWRNSATGIILEPIELLEKLVPLIPPREHLIRYAGILAPSADWNSLVIPQPDESAAPSAADPRPIQTTPQNPGDLLDSVGFGLTRLASASNRRKVILIISDGNDRSSSDTADQVAMLAGSSDVSIYVISLIQLYESRVSTPGVLSGPALLDAIAERSGGRHFAGADASDFPEVMKRVSVELRNSYLLGYQPTNPRDGKFRQTRGEISAAAGNPVPHSHDSHGYYASAPLR